MVVSSGRITQHKLIQPLPKEELLIKPQLDIHFAFLIFFLQKGKDLSCHYGARPRLLRLIEPTKLVRVLYGHVGPPLGGCQEAYPDLP